jgi:hypothetical protein
MEILTSAIRSKATVRVNVRRTRDYQPDHYIGRVLAIAEEHSANYRPKLVMAVRNGDEGYRTVVIGMAQVGGVILGTGPTTQNTAEVPARKHQAGCLAYYNNQGDHRPCTCGGAA